MTSLKEERGYAMKITEKSLSVAQELTVFKNELKKSRRDRRARISHYLREMGTSISGVSSVLRQGNVPKGKCSEFGTNADLLADVLYETVGDAMFEGELIDLANVMKPARGAKKLYNEMKKSASSEAEIEKLDKAAVLFRKLSKSIHSAP